MENQTRDYQTDVIKRNFKGLRVIVTDSARKLANIAVISDVLVLKNENDLILEITGNKKSCGKGMYILAGGTYYKICFEIDSSHVSFDILNSYMACYSHKVQTIYSIFDFARNEDILRQVKAYSEEKFLSWYTSRRTTDTTIEDYDGVWISGKYVKFLPVIPPSVEFTIAELLFTRFNMQREFTTVGKYEYYVASDEETLGHYESYTTINGIVMPDVEEFKIITNSEIVVVDKFGEEYSLYAEQEEVSYETA